MGRKKKGESDLLTDFELLIMTILWRLGCATVNEVLEHLPEEKDLAYTTVSTVLRLLEKREVVVSEKEGRTHVYVPQLTKEVYESKSLSHVVNNVFEGTPSRLVKRLIDDSAISEDELYEIKRFLDQRM